MRLQAYSVMVGQDDLTDLAAEALQCSFLEATKTTFDSMISKAPLRNTTILRSKILKERKERRQWFNRVKSRCIFLVNYRCFSSKIGADFGRDLLNGYSRLWKKSA